MTRRLAFVSIVLALLPAFAVAAAPDEPNDSEDLLYLGKDRLIVVRLHIRIDGKSFEAVWNEYIDKLLGDLDKDGDGVLNGKEAAQLPTRNQLAQAGLIRRDRFSSGRTPAADRSPRDGKVTRQELAVYIRNLGMGPFSTQIDQRSQARPSPSSFSNRRGPQGTELFGHLDINQDGKLSKDEFAAAFRTLHKADLDDDETISMAELQPVRNPYYLAVAASQQQPTNQQPFFTTLSAAESPSKLLSQLLERYDRADAAPTPDGKLSKDNNLSREEIGLDQKSFQQFDADGNGLLDFDELMQFVRKPPPAVEVIVRIGQRKPSEQLVEIVKSNADLAANVRKSAGGLVTVMLGKVQLEIGADPSSFRVQDDIYKAQFKAADTDNNKYLEFKEVERNPYFRNTYYLMDRDSDGKVFEEEMLAFIEQQTAAARS